MLETIQLMTEIRVTNNNRCITPNAGVENLKAEHKQSLTDHSKGMQARFRPTQKDKKHINRIIPYNKLHCRISH
jgi:hypothetical protein